MSSFTVLHHHAPRSQLLYSASKMFQPTEIMLAVRNHPLGKSFLQNQCTLTSILKQQIQPQHPCNDSPVMLSMATVTRSTLAATHDKRFKCLCRYSRCQKGVTEAPQV